MIVAAQWIRCRPARIGYASGIPVVVFVPRDGRAVPLGSNMRHPCVRDPRSGANCERDAGMNRLRIFPAFGEGLDRKPFRSAGSMVSVRLLAYQNLFSGFNDLL
jgi:hypothetical protein